MTHFKLLKKNVLTCPHFTHTVSLKHMRVDINGCGGHSGNRTLSILVAGISKKQRMGLFSFEIRFNVSPDIMYYSKVLFG